MFKKYLFFLILLLVISSFGFMVEQANEYSVLKKVDITDYCAKISVPSNFNDTQPIDTDTTKLFVPEAFTPNNDGINDVLSVFGNYYNLRLFIYSSNGELIYSMFPESDPWDGNYDGIEMPNGTYIWKAFFTDQKGTQYNESGNVILIR
jgi:gliding motility-associated-like protein